MVYLSRAAAALRPAVVNLRDGRRDFP